MRDLDLDTFFQPRTVAIVGASDTPKRPNTAMTIKIRRWAEHAGATIFPVNPNRDTVDGLPCFATMADLPEPVDLVCFLVGDPIEVLPDAIAAGARFGVVFAAGFAEVGDDGEQREADLAELIAASDLRVLGPNTNLNAFELFREDLPGKAIALITQSGHQGRPVFQAQQLGIKLSHWAPTGNEVDLEFADFASWFSRQEDVGAIAAYIEGFKDGRSLLLAADEAARNGVPIVAVKVGRTDEGQSMAKAHTGHLTGSDEVISAAFRQYGITRVDGLDELTDTAALFARCPSPPKGDGVCIYAISGGTGAHMADMAAAAGLSLPDLEPATQDKLREVIPDYLRVSNPVDSGGPPSGDAVKGPIILDAILDDPNVDVVICPITGAVHSMSLQLAKDLVAASKRTDKPICVIWGSPDSEDEAYKDILLNSQVPVFRTFANCVNAVRAWFDWHGFQQRYSSPFASSAEVSPAAAEVREVIGSRSALSEVASKNIIARYGVPVGREVLAATAEEAAAAAREIGRPVVLKAVSPDLGHKSELGLVRVGVGIEDAGDVAAALFGRAAEVAPEAVLEGVLVAEMASGGVETVVGIATDDLFGPVVMFGLGGVFVEVLEDVTFRVPPFDRDEAHRMIREVKGFPLLEGVRGGEPADLEALVDVIMGVERMAMELADCVAELDINPLLVGPSGVVALDALVVPR
ncbi:MAG: acetate--CoA ligase family protein [Nitriliruptorales bacterium]|nr:acetate--CoA ligase family protein [Nitriliruptorales bacterium]